MNITPADIRAAIGTSWSNETLEAAILEAAQVGRVSVEAINGSRRDKPIAWARHCAWWLAWRKGVTRSFIASQTGRDISTVRSGIAAAQARYNANRGAKS